MLRGKGLATHGLQQLDALLDPLPSLEHAGVPFRVWVEFRAQLLGHVTEAFQDRLADGVDLLEDAGLAVLSQLFTRTIQLQAWLGSVALSTASNPDGPIANVAPQHELLGFLLLLLERRDNAAAGKGGTLSLAGAQHAAAVASQLVSWVRRTNIAAPDAMRLARRSSGPLLELQEAALRFLLLRFASDVQSSSAVLLPLLGDVSMVVMTLVLRNPDQEESLVPHRGLLLAICWKLFLLVEHADADVRNGATQNLKSLFSHAWFQKEAFGDSPLVFEVVSFCPALALARPQSARAHTCLPRQERLQRGDVAALRNEKLVALLDNSLGVRWRDATQRHQQDATAFDTKFASDQQAKVVAEQKWQRAASTHLTDASAVWHAATKAGTQAVERRVQALTLAGGARDQTQHRALRLLYIQQLLQHSAWEGADQECNALTQPANWVVDSACVSPLGGTRRKLHREDQELLRGVASRPWMQLAPLKQLQGEPGPKGALVGEELQGVLNSVHAFKPDDLFDAVHLSGIDAAPGVLILAPDRCFLLQGHRRAGRASDAEASVERRPAAVSPQKHAGDAAAKRAEQPPCTYEVYGYADLLGLVRRRAQLQPCALQLLMRDGTSVFLRLEGGEPARNALHSRLAPLLPRNEQPTERIRAVSGGGGGSEGLSARWSVFGNSQLSQLTDGWTYGRVSNFEYLMGVNEAAGRCYDDLMQYPVFPWLLARYQADSCPLRDAASFRDLRKPMGAQSAVRAEQFRRRHAEWEDPTSDTPPFHYGTHYSSAASVCSFLLRLQPFTDYHCALQDGRFDLADRLFHSVGEEWSLASGERGGDTGCVKELIPELFYMPEALLNVNSLRLGQRQDGATLNHAQLPPWARGSAWKFVRRMRQAGPSDALPPAAQARAPLTLHRRGGRHSSPRTRAANYPTGSTWYLVTSSKARRRSMP